MCKAMLEWDGTVIHLAEIAMTTLPVLSHIDSNRLDVLASQCLETVQDFCRDASIWFISCDLTINVVKVGFIHGRVAVTFESYHEATGHIALKNPVLEKLRRVCDKCFFVLPKSKRLSVALTQGENGLSSWLKYGYCFISELS